MGETVLKTWAHSVYPGGGSDGREGLDPGAGGRLERQIPGLPDHPGEPDGAISAGHGPDRLAGRDERLADGEIAVGADPQERPRRMAEVRDLRDRLLAEEKAFRPVRHGRPVEPDLGGQRLAVELEPEPRVAAADPPGLADVVRDAPETGPREGRPDVAEIVGFDEQVAATAEDRRRDDGAGDRDPRVMCVE